MQASTVRTGLTIDYQPVTRERHHVTLDSGHHFSEAMTSARTLSKSKDPPLQGEARPVFVEAGNDDGTTLYGAIIDFSIEACRERLAHVHLETRSDAKD